MTVRDRRSFLGSFAGVATAVLAGCLRSGFDSASTTPGRWIPVEPVPEPPSAVIEYRSPERVAELPSDSVGVLTEYDWSYLGIR